MKTVLSFQIDVVSCSTIGAPWWLNNQRLIRRSDNGDKYTKQDSRQARSTVPIWEICINRFTIAAWCVLKWRIMVKASSGNFLCRSLHIFGTVSGAWISSCSFYARLDGGIMEAGAIWLTCSWPYVVSISATGFFSFLVTPVPAVSFSSALVPHESGQSKGNEAKKVGSRITFSCPFFGWAPKAKSSSLMLNSEPEKMDGESWNWDYRRRDVLVAVLTNRQTGDFMS